MEPMEQYCKEIGKRYDEAIKRIAELEAAIQKHRNQTENGVSGQFAFIDASLWAIIEDE